MVTLRVISDVVLFMGFSDWVLFSVLSGRVLLRVLSRFILSLINFLSSLIGISQFNRNELISKDIFPQLQDKFHKNTILFPNFSARKFCLVEMPFGKQFAQRYRLPFLTND